MSLDALSSELKKNEKIKQNIENSLQKSASQRKTLSNVLLKIFNTIQDKIHQLSTQLTQVTSCLEGSLESADELKNREDFQQALGSKDKEIDQLVRRCDKLQQFGGDNNRKKPHLFSTKDRSERSLSRRPMQRETNFMERDEGSDFGRLSKGHSRSFILSSNKKPQQEARDLRSEDAQEKPQFYLSPEKLLKPKHGGLPQSTSVQGEPLNRLQKARLLSHRCKSFLSPNANEKPNKSAKSIEIIPQGLRDYLQRLKSGPADSRPSHFADHRESIVPHQRQGSRVGEESYNLINDRIVTSFRDEIAKNSKDEQEMKEECRSNKRKKLNCARKLTFEEVSPPAPNANLAVEGDRAALIVSLSEEYLKKRKITKVKSAGKNRAQIPSFLSPPRNNPPLSISTNIATSNCFLLGASNRSAVKRKSSVDLKEALAKGEATQSVSNTHFLQESLMQAANPFRVFCSPSKKPSVSYR